MSHPQFRPMYLLAANGSQQYFVPQAIPALSQINGENVIRSQYPVVPAVPATLPQPTSLYYHSLPPASFTQPYTTYQPDHTPTDDSSDVQLPHDPALPDTVIYSDMSTVPFSPPQTPQLPEQLEQQPPCAKRHSSAVAIIHPDTLEEVNVDDNADPNDKHSVESKETVDNTWMVVEDITVALTNLKEEFEKFRYQVTKELTEFRNQNHEFRNQVTKDVKELRDQVTKNHEDLLDLRALISVSNVWKSMVAKSSEIDSYEKFCILAREADLPCELEDYEEFKYNKERMVEINSRLYRKLLCL